MSSVAKTATASTDRQRPRERLERLGPRALSEPELLALVLGHGGPAGAVHQVAGRLAATTLRDLSGRQLEEWRLEPGVGEAQSARLVAMFEIARRVNAPRPPRRESIRQPRDVGPYLMVRYGDEREECFGVLLLDARNRLLREHRLSRGGWCASVVRPREVFRQALLAGAPAIILFHNHPSGDPTPSREDVAITAQLHEAGELLGIRVLDHLIVGAEGFVSLRERQAI